MIRSNSFWTASKSLDLSSLVYVSADTDIMIILESGCVVDCKLPIVYSRCRGVENKDCSKGNLKLFELL